MPLVGAVSYGVDRGVDMAISGSSFPQWRVSILAPPLSNSTMAERFVEGGPRFIAPPPAV